MMRPPHPATPRLPAANPRRQQIVRWAVCLAAVFVVAIALGARGTASASRAPHTALGQPASAGQPAPARPAPIDVQSAAAHIRLPEARGNPANRADRRAMIRSETPADAWQRHIAPGLATQEDLALAAVDHPTEAQLEQLRGKLKTYFAELEQAAELLPGEQRLDFPEALDGAGQEVDALTVEQLHELHLALRPYPGFWNISSFAYGALASAGTGTNVLTAPAPGPSLPLLPSIPRGVAPDTHSPPVPEEGPDQYANCADFKFAGLCDDCPPYPVMEGSALPLLFALDTAAWAAGAVCSYFDGDITIFGTQIPNIVKIICVVGQVVLQGIADGIQLQYDLNGECEGDYRRHVIDAYMDAPIFSRASQKSHDFRRLWELRIYIENAMLQEGNIRTSMLQLPASQGGYLDREDDVSVRYVVRDTILTFSSPPLNYDVRNAQTEYAVAEAHLAAGRFKDAFARYRLAYRAAVRVGREP